MTDKPTTFPAHFVCAALLGLAPYRVFAGTVEQAPPARGAEFALSPSAVVTVIGQGLPDGLTPSLIQAAGSYGLSPQSLDKLSAFAEHAQASRAQGRLAERTAAPLASDAQALETIHGLEKRLRSLSAEALRQPGAAEAFLDRSLWDGAQTLKSDDSRAYWEGNKERIIAEAQSVRRLVERRRDDIRADQGEEALIHDMNKGAVVARSLGGEAKITLVDGQPFVRVAHKPTELSLLFLNADKVSAGSAHLRRLVARQMMDAGSDRDDGRRGRTPVLLWERNGSIVSTQYIERPKPWQLEWWRQYGRATYQAPSASDRRLAVPMALAQGALALGLETVKTLLGSPAGSMAAFWAPVGFTMVFGFIVGTYLGTYKNWVYRGHWIAQLLKAAVVSTSFAYPVLLATQGAAAFASLFTHVHVVYNVLLNNLGGVVWRQIPRMAERHRLYAGKYVLGMKRQDVLYQANYLINWTLRLGDLLHVPGGLAVFLMSIPSALGIGYLFARAHGFPEADRMRTAPARALERARAAAAGVYDAASRLRVFRSFRG